MGKARFFLKKFVEVPNVFSSGFQWFTIMFPKFSRVPQAVANSTTLYILPFNLLRLDQREKLHNILLLLFYYFIFIFKKLVVYIVWVVFVLVMGNLRGLALLLKRKKILDTPQLNPKPTTNQIQQTNRYPKLFGKVANIDHGFLVGGFHVWIIHTFQVHGVKNMCPLEIVF